MSEREILEQLYDDYFKKPDEIFVPCELARREYNTRRVISYLVYKTYLYDGSKFYTILIDGKSIKSVAFSSSVSAKEAEIRIFLRICKHAEKHAKDNVNKIKIFGLSHHVMTVYNALIKGTEIEDEIGNNVIVQSVKNLHFKNQVFILMYGRNKVKRLFDSTSRYGMRLLKTTQRVKRLILQHHMDYINQQGFYIHTLMEPTTHSELVAVLKMNGLLGNENPKKRLPYSKYAREKIFPAHFYAYEYIINQRGKISKNFFRSLRRKFKEIMKDAELMPGDFREGFPYMIWLNLDLWKYVRDEIPKRLEYDMKNNPYFRKQLVYELKSWDVYSIFVTDIYSRKKRKYEFINKLDGRIIAHLEKAGLINRI